MTNKKPSVLEDARNKLRVAAHIYHTARGVKSKARAYDVLENAALALAAVILLENVKEL